ncbi:hypothetical protein KCP69_09840 [Salmonella enterica subsp. enterica]|nr:hypothetical protein KCP69_09840 [Salmonella enterica subsp. enterica]
MATLTGARKRRWVTTIMRFRPVLTIRRRHDSAAQENEPFLALPLAEFRTVTSRKPFNPFAELNNTGSAGVFPPGHCRGFSVALVENYREGWSHIDRSATYRKSVPVEQAAGGTRSACAPSRIC